MMCKVFVFFCFVFFVATDIQIMCHFQVQSIASLCYVYPDRGHDGGCAGVNVRANLSEAKEYLRM